MNVQDDFNFKHRIDWSLITQDCIPIRDLIAKWEVMLSQRLTETQYHNFIRRHANLFLVDGMSSHFSVSKMKLGSELELDFAVPNDQRSRGLFWTLIEIKRPHDSLFSSDGTPSKHLNRALQQVRDWRRWLRENRDATRRLFAVWGVRTQLEPNFRFQIIIGRRDQDERWFSHRNQIADEQNVEIRSFDYLTDRLRGRVFRREAFLADGSWDRENPDLACQLANPFVESFTDSLWKRFLREPASASGSHFTSSFASALVHHRTLNRSLWEQVALHIAANRTDV